MDYLNYRHTIRHLLSTPFIWVMIVPVALADLLGEIYHRICFPLYGLPYVKRSQYIGSTWLSFGISTWRKN